MKGFSRILVIKKVGGTGFDGVCLVAKSCLILCDSMHCCPPGSSVHGISQARTLEWVAISSSRGSTYPTQGSNPHLGHWQEDSLPPGSPMGLGTGYKQPWCPGSPSAFWGKLSLKMQLLFWTLERHRSGSFPFLMVQMHLIISNYTFKMHPESDRFSLLHLPCESSLQARMTS